MHGAHRDDGPEEFADEDEPDTTEPSSAIGARVATDPGPDPSDPPGQQPRPQQRPAKPQAIPGEPASFGRRLGAYAIDVVVLGLANSLISQLVLGPIPENVDLLDPNLEVLWPYYALNATVAWLYFAGLESSKLQATLGKRLLSVRVTDGEGERASFFRTTGRHFSKILSALPFGLGFLLIFTDDDNQALHDRLTSCLIRHDPDSKPRQRPDRPELEDER